ncbi:MAG: hypothetical protein ACKOKF_04680 [Bacteroidota bacterium]
MRHLLHTRILICSITALLLGSTSMLSAQSLTSDQPDYPPGSVATFFGMGFAPYDTVTLHVEHVNMMADDSATYDSSQYIPWTVVADSMGDFTTQWVVCSCDGDTLMAVATGTSGSTANVVFTDGVVPITSISIISSNSLIQSAAAGDLLSYPIQVTTGDINNPASISISFVGTNATLNGGSSTFLGTFSPSLPGIGINATLTPTLSLNTSALSEGTYNFNIRAQAGNGQNFKVSPETCTLTICRKPLITDQPFGGNVCQGSTDTLSVTATSSSTLSYQWRKIYREGFH